MKHLWKKLALGLGVAAALAGAPAARADIVELKGGRVVQGRLLDGLSTAEGGLAVELFETGGVIVVRWDHILPARATELRIKMGFESPETPDEIMVQGHSLLLVSGMKIEGKVLNPDEKDRAVQLKTARSVQQIERATVQRIDEIPLPALMVYTPDELYQMEHDRAPPDSSAANYDLAKFAARVGALQQAKQHLAAAKDPAFLQSPEGRTIPQFERKLDLLIKCQGANELKVQIEVNMRSNRWNEALALVNQIDKTYTDEAVRSEIRFNGLQTRVVMGRQAYFKKTVQKEIYKTMRKMIETKSREKKAAPNPNDPPRGAAPGTLAAARQWMTKDLPKAMWDKVQSDLGITDSGEMDTFWKERSGTSPQVASYGQGSFIVVKKVSAAKPGGSDPQRPQRPRPGAGGQQGGPPRQVKEVKPLTEEEWWEGATATQRRLWMEAWFAENSQIFVVIRADESEICESCGGTGAKKSLGADGSESSTVCPICNSAGKTRKVYYR